MQKLFTTCLSLFLFFSTAGIACGQTTLDTAVDFNIKDIHGNKFILSELLDSNNYVVLEFFSTSCGPCVTYAPDIQQAYVQYGSNQNGVVFIGLAWEQLNADVAAFDAANGITYPTVSGQGYSYQVITDYNCQSFPTMLVIAPNRQILAKQIWPPSFHNIDSVLTNVLTLAAVNETPANQSMRLISTFPNPVSRNLTCRLMLPGQSIISYEIYGSKGDRVCLSGPVQLEAGPQNLVIPVEQLKAGIYFAKVMTAQGTFCSLKFIRQ